MKKAMTRKEFLQLFTFGLVTAGTLPLFTQCSGKKEEIPAKGKTSSTTDTSQVDLCGDLSGLTDDEIEVRKNFEYVGQTKIAEERCNNCQFWVAPKAGEKCGGCTIMNGPINPQGYCTAWVAIES